MRAIPFRHRAHEVTRLEAFSDIVFGFALTLIVVSLEVPKSFDELFESMRGFFAFAICFAMLIWLWHAHHTFFRRYALQDEYTILLNTILLFLVLFYVYPLKFLFSLFTRVLVAHPKPGQLTALFIIYGLGFSSVFLMLFLLYQHAWKKRDALELNAIEQHDTRMHLWMYGGNVVIGLISATVAFLVPERSSHWAGWTYFLIGISETIIGSRFGARRRALEEAMVNAKAAT